MIIYADNLNVFPELLHGFGDRSAPFPDAVSGRVELGFDPQRLVWGRQVHGVAICKVEDTLPISPVEGIDASMTDRPGVIVAVKTADCVPVLLYDPVHHAVAAIHSGRVGTEKDIVGVVIAAMTEAYGTLPREVIAALGPALCATCYEVDEASYQRFVEATGVRGEYRHPDMKAAIRRQLSTAGVEKIGDIDRCTLEDDRWFSYRRHCNEGRQISFIGMR